MNEKGNIMKNFTRMYFCLSLIFLSFALIEEGRTESCPGRLKCHDKENNKILGELATDDCVAHKHSKTCTPSKNHENRIKNMKRCEHEVPACKGGKCDPEIYCSHYEKK